MSLTQNVFSAISRKFKLVLFCATIAKVKYMFVEETCFKSHAHEGVCHSDMYM